MSLTVHRLDVRDWQVLRDVRIASLRDSPAFFGGTLPAALARTPEEWQDQVQKFPCFVAVEDEHPVGMVRWMIDPPEPGAAGAAQGSAIPQLISMWVAPEARGQRADGSSVARELIEHVVMDAREAGYAILRLWVARENLRALRAYEKAGFRPTGRQQVDGPDSVIEFEMCRDLRDESALEAVIPPARASEPTPARRRGTPRSGRSRRP